MKNLLTISALIAVKSPFAFWKMEGPYEDSSFLQIGYSFLIEPDTRNIEEESTCYFLYDKNTRNCLGRWVSIESDKRYNPHPINQASGFYYENALYFLRGRFNYDQTFWNKANRKKYCFPIYSIRSLLYKKQPINQKEETCIHNNIKIKLELESKSGIKIKNTENGVVLSNKEKSIDLTTALRKYFVKSVDSYELADNFTQFVNSPEEPELRQILQFTLNRMNHPSLNEKSFNLLQTSTILAVWYLIPSKTYKYKIKDQRIVKEKKYNVESQMIGLAKDKNGELFHWTTDLKQDISVLMKYASKDSKCTIKN